MDGFLKQSTVVTVKIGKFLDSTDGNTAENGLTITQSDVLLSKNGGALTQKNESSNTTVDGTTGFYDCDLDATDTGTLGILKLVCHMAGALYVSHTYMVIPATVYDSLVSGSDYLDVATAELANIDLSATMKASVNTEVDNALDTAIPAEPTADSINERVATMDGTVATILTNTTALKKIGVNKWAIVDTSFIIYDDDDTTPLYSFTLDSATSPTSRTPA